MITSALVSWLHVLGVALGLGAVLAGGAQASAAHTTRGRGVFILIMACAAFMARGLLQVR